MARPAIDESVNQLLEEARVDAFARYLLEDEAAAEDVTQELRLVALEQRPREPEKARAWLAAVTRNMVRRRHRSLERRARRERRAARPEALPSALDIVTRREVRERVRVAVARLPESLRSAVRLRYGEDLPVREVAAREGIPLETARSRLRLARDRLRTDLAALAGERRPAWSRVVGLLLGRAPDGGSGAVSAGTIVKGGIAMASATKAALVVGAATALAVSFWAGTRTGGGDRTRESLAAPAEDARLNTLRSELEASRLGEAAAEERARRLGVELARLRAAAEAEPAGSAPPRPESPIPESGPAAPVDPTLARERIGTGLREEPGTPAHEGALGELADYLVAAAERKDGVAVRWAEDRFDSAARGERVTPAEAEMLEGRFRRLPAGHGARPGIGIGVAGGWAGDDRLGGFLRNLRSTAEKDLHSRLFRVLDHHPSEAFGDYAVRMLRETDGGGVLRAVLDEDRVDAVCASGRAREFAAALEDRLRSGPDLGQREDLALGLALLALRDPDAALARFRRVAADEADPAAARKLRAALELVESGKATVKSLEDLLD